MKQLNPDTIQPNWPCGPDYSNEEVKPKEPKQVKWSQPEPTIINFIAGHFDRQGKKNRYAFKKLASKIRKPKTVTVELTCDWQIKGQHDPLLRGEK